MNLRARELTARVTSANERLEDGLLRQSDVSGLLGSVLVEQAELSAVSRVAGKLVENLIPHAAIARLDAEARLFSARADEVASIAHARFERTAELMRAAADHESGISVDIKSTFSGALLSYADELNREAGQCRKGAEASQQQYDDMTVKLAALQRRGVKGTI